MTTPNNMNIDPATLEGVLCEAPECDNQTFSPTFIIKRISALMSPTGKESLAPIQIFKCDVCGHINELFLEGLTN